MINFREGDLIEMFERGEFDCIAHQCNCTVGLGAGIAKSLANKYPKLIEQDKFSRSLSTEVKFGSAPHVGIELKNKEHASIFNLYAQFYHGSPSNKVCHDSELVDDFNTRIIMLKTSINYMFRKMTDFSYKTCGIPCISSGLARAKGYSTMSDLDYFKMIIQPYIEEIIKLYPNIQLTVVNFKK